MKCILLTSPHKLPPQCIWTLFDLMQTFEWSGIDGVHTNQISACQRPGCSEELGEADEKRNETERKRGSSFRFSSHLLNHSCKWQDTHATMQSHTHTHCRSININVIFNTLNTILTLNSILLNECLSHWNRPKGRGVMSC